jgi:hypothetical protein
LEIVNTCPQPPGELGRQANVCIALRASNGSSCPYELEPVVFRGESFVLRNPRSPLQSGETLWYVRKGEFAADHFLGGGAVRLWLTMEPELSLGKLLQPREQLTCGDLGHLVASLWPAAELSFAETAQILNSGDTEKVEAVRVKISLLLAKFGIRCVRLEALDSLDFQPEQIDRHVGLELRLGVPHLATPEAAMIQSPLRARPNTWFVWSQLEADHRLKKYLIDSLHWQEAAVQHWSQIQPAAKRMACRAVEKQLRYLLDLLQTLPAFDAGPRATRPGFWQSEEFLHAMESAANATDSLQAQLGQLLQSPGSNFTQYQLDLTRLEQVLAGRRS